MSGEPVAGPAAPSGEGPEAVPVLVVGTVALDSIRTPFGEVREQPGGSAVYFALAASRFAPVNLVGVVGEDFDDRHLEVLASRPVDLRGLERQPGRTFRWSGEYHHDMSQAKTLATELNVLAGFEPEIPEPYRQSPFVFLANIDPVAQQRVLDQVATPRFIAADTMNYWIDSKLESLKQLLRRVDCLVINEGEARMLGKEVPLARAAREIRALGPRVLVVKRGEYGLAMFSDAGVFAAPGLPLERVVDPTGAGDSFAGGMMGWLALTGDHGDGNLRRALVYGSVMASFTVEEFGLGRLAAVTPQDVRERCARFEGLTRFGPL